MEFRLVYQGPLNSNGKPQLKQEIRRHFHVQLSEHIQRKGMTGFRYSIRQEHGVTSPYGTIIESGGFTFVPVITEKLRYAARLNITLLAPEEPGGTVTQGGDLDNRIKTLFDALRVPTKKGEIPIGDTPQKDETPFYCLLEDDALITGVSVIKDRLLAPPKDGKKSDVLLIIHVVPESTSSLMGVIFP